MYRAAAVMASVLTALAGRYPAAQPAPQPSDGQSFTATATAILVDVIVRDRKGRPVTDLSADDFSVAEDGVAQKVDTFTRVSRGGGIGVNVAWKAPGGTIAVTPPPAPGSDAALDAPTEQATTALVFDHLSSESLRLAQRATLDYVPMNDESSVRIGVFATDPGVRVLQPFTLDRTLVRRAVARIVPSGTAAEEQKVERSDELTERKRSLEGETRAAAASGVNATGATLARTSSQIGERETELRLIQTELNMLRSFDNLDRTHKGYDTAQTLLTVVQQLASIPGRKTIVFFSEGLPVSPALSARLDSVIDVANRANVTAYAVDAKGLQSKSLLTNARKEMNDFAEERLNQVATGTDRTEQPLTMAFERVEDTLRLDSRTGLARLSEETGGFLIEQTNDLSSAFRRIDEDNRFHYLLTYSPTNAGLDGKFRAIQVKVRRPGTQVFARKGYRAFRAGTSAMADSYEVPALALLDRTPIPNAFAIQAAGFSFPDPARPGLSPVLVHVGTGELRFNIDRQRSTYAGRAAVVVRIRDGHGRDVQKLSQHYLLTGDAKDLEAARNGEILFYREVDLPPGVYTAESIVYDANAGQGSVRVSTLTVPAAAATLGMSSLIVVDRIEEIDDPPSGPSTPPLYVGRMLLYPNLGEPLRKSAAAELPFYFTLYGSSAGAQAYAQLLRNGEFVAEAPVQLPPAAGARVRHVGRFPIGSLPAGTYELRIRVTDIGREISRTAFFTLQER